MPPRLQLPSASCLRPENPPTLTPFLLPFLFQRRCASILGSLSDNPGAYNKQKRVGRGPASGYGKTSGRGHKGQKQHGKVPRAFNGGQTTDEVVHGPRGFTNNFSVDLSPVNLDKIQQWIDKGKIDPSKPITLRELAKSRCIHGVKEGVKLLAKNADTLKTPINIVVSRASAAAIAAVEKAGGSVLTRYYTPFAVRRIMQGQMSPIASVDAIGGPLEAISPMSTLVSSSTAASTDRTGDESDVQIRLPALPSFQYRLPDPVGRRDIEYYRDPAHRGYLVHTMRKGEGPSLFFKPPGSKTSKAGGEQKKKNTNENKLW